jgi:hypothetical protein
MTPNDLDKFATSLGQSLALDIRGWIDRRLDERLERERAYTREVAKAEVEPVRAENAALRRKLAAIEAVVSGARGRKAA